MIISTIRASSSDKSLAMPMREGGVELFDFGYEGLRLRSSNQARTLGFGRILSLKEAQAWRDEKWLRRYDRGK